MTTFKSIPALCKELQELLVEDLPATLRAIKELLPETSEKHGLVVALLTRLQQLNKDRIRGVIDTGEYATRIAKINADTYDMINDFQEEDFVPEKSGSGKSNSAKLGNVLYRIPHKMPLKKSSLCTIRVAVDEDALIEDIIIDDDVRLRQRVEVSERMSAELIDIEGGVFDIVGFNTAQQNVRDSGYTQWLFRVTPRVEGEFQLMVKVSLLEFDRNKNEYVPREVSIMETVTIVTEFIAASENEESPLKFSGHQIVLGPDESIVSAPSKTINKKFGALAAFLGLLILASAATLATFSPYVELLYTGFLAKANNTPSSYDGYIQKYKDKTADYRYYEDACFQKAGMRNTLPGYREYQLLCPNGKHYPIVTERIRALELLALEQLHQQTESDKIRQYLIDFPDAEYLPEAKKMVDADVSLQNAFNPMVESAYIRTMLERPSVSKGMAYLHDFPNLERLNDLILAALTAPDVFGQLQDELEKAYLKKMEQSPTLQQANKFWEFFPHPINREYFEKILSEKPDLISTTIAQNDRASVAKKENEETQSLILEFQNNIEQNSNAQQKSEVGVDTDTDGDGIPDKTDNCPTEFGKANTRGCPSIIIPNANSNTASEEKKSEKNKKSGLSMKDVPGGTFTMGSPDMEINRDSDECQHIITVASFKIGYYEVTQADWDEVMGKSDKDPKLLGCNECPVVNVSWNDIQKFIIKLNEKQSATEKPYRLPTEAEWEFAARGGKNASQYHIYAGSDNSEQVAWARQNSNARLHHIGEKNPNELGLFDMSGNVWEWCEDIYLPYPCDKKTSGNSKLRVLRGGSYLEEDAVRSAARSNLLPKRGFADIGFRLAKD